MTPSLTKILEQEQAANIVLINAAEECLSLSAYLVNQLQLKHPSQQKYQYFADRYFDFTQIKDILNSGSLFDDTTYIEINYKNKPVAEQQKAISDICPDINTNTFMLITTDRLNKTDFGAKWVKAIEDNGWVISLAAADSVVIIKHMLKQNNLSIDNDALDLLLQLNHGNASELMQEVNRLALSFPAGHSIGANDIKQHSSDNAQYNIYQLSNAYLSGNLKQTLNIINNIYQASEDAILIMWIIAEDLRKLIRLKAGMKRNQDFNQLAREFKIWGNSLNSFQAANQRLSYTTLVNTLDEVANLDMMIKGLINQDIKLQLIKIVGDLCSKGSKNG